MKKKLNLYSALLLVALIVLTATNVFHVDYHGHTVYGYEDEKLEMVDMPQEFYTVDSIEGGVRTNWLPTYEFTVNVRNHHIGGRKVLMSTGYTKDNNGSAIEKQSFLVEMQKVSLKAPMSKFKQSKMTIVIAATNMIVGILLVVWILVMVFALLRNIRNGNVFVSKVAKYLETTGILLAISYVWQFIGSYIITKHFQNTVAMADYEIVFQNECNSMILIMGLTLMIISQVILLGKEMKEEQELTI